MRILLAIRAMPVRMPHYELKWEIPVNNWIVEGGSSETNIYWCAE